MARELRIGDKVRTPRGVELVVSRTADTVCTSDAMDAPAWWDPGDITPLPADIPRERVADLHVAVTKRLWMLADEMSHEGHESDDVRGYPHPRICITCTRDEDHEVEFYVREGTEAEAARFAHSELSKVAEALRLLLEVEP